MLNRTFIKGPPHSIQQIMSSFYSHENNFLLQKLAYEATSLRTLHAATCKSDDQPPQAPVLQGSNNLQWNTRQDGVNHVDSSRSVTHIQTNIVRRRDLNMITTANWARSAASLPTHLITASSASVDDAPFCRVFSAPWHGATTCPFLSNQSSKQSVNDRTDKVKTFLPCMLYCKRRKLPSNKSSLWKSWKSPIQDQKHPLHRPLRLLRDKHGETRNECKCQRRPSNEWNLQQGIDPRHWPVSNYRCAM